MTTDNLAEDKLDKLLNGLDSLTVRINAMETKVHADAASTPEDKKGGEQLDKILAHLDALHKRMDSFEERLEGKKKADAEKEAEEELKKDAKKKDDESEEEEHKKDAKKKDADPAKEERKDAKKDGEESEEMQDAKRRKDAQKKDEDEKAHKDSQNFASMRAELDAMKLRMPVDMKEEDRAQFVSSQVKADKVAQAFGDAAPRWQSGENLLQYRKRLLRNYQSYSPKFKGVDIDKDIGASALDHIEDIVFADAVSAAMNPSVSGEPFLRGITEKDQTGRSITRFYGSPEACWGPFKMPSRSVIGINKKFD